MHSFFSSQFFTDNRARLRADVTSGAPIVICSNGSMQRAADEPYKFIQDSNFWYLTGINAPDLTLVITQSATYLIVPVLSLEREIFDGAHDIAEFSRSSGITDIVDEREGWVRLKQDVARGHTAAVLSAVAPYMKRYQMHSLPYRKRLVERLKRLDKTVSFEDIRPLLAAARSIKQAEELRALQRAIDITIETLHDVTKPDILRDASYEYELEAALSYGFRRRGADGHAFEPIVGAGQHSTTLHHVDNVGKISQNDLIVLDVGASFEHYAADITRTVSAQPFTKRQKAVYKAVLKVQDHALNLLKPGILLHDYEQAVVDFMGEQLIALGLITKPDHASIRQYFPHATSHFLGLDTHDVGLYDKPLQAGMVVTCEPGIYIPEEQIGIRIEDDVWIAEGGNKVLSSACPRNLAQLQS